MNSKEAKEVGMPCLKGDGRGRVAGMRSGMYEGTGLVYTLSYTWKKWETGEGSE